MDIQEVLQWTDEQVFAKTGKHFDSLQKLILEEVWQGKKYTEIAKKCNRSEEHIKQVARKLWKLLSELLEEDIKQANVRSILERKVISTIYNYGKSSQIVGYMKSHINICTENRPYPEEIKPPSPSPPDTPQNKNQTPIIDLTQAPALTEYYPRTTEETTLKNWILNTTTPLITIYGLNGIGKSSLTLQLIQEIQTEFDYIIWQSLNDKPTLTTLQTNLKQIFSQTQKTPFPTILDYFRTYRCLVIIDDLQNIFKTREIAGQYLHEYEDYHNFFKQIATTTHQSCLILLTSEKPREITALEGENRPAKKLHLKGLGEQAKQILKQQQLNGEEKWPELITLYQSHPTWLNIIASTIQEFFNGSVSQYLADPNDIYLGEIEPALETQLQRLSDSEKTVIRWLAGQTKPVEISQGPVETALSKTQFLQAIESLNRRSLVEKEQLSAKARFQINPIFKQYIQSNYSIS
ncbi:AAA family ATPase [Ancylothrix sp. C2]|uniref:NB-ARC domain-containing protein n=1 Tax=Ancylothrix sp. D3o TaxID=2953691 RepID=UPI0021BB6ED2|nr:NB-ARC domain-containing protein [Ancylothrix sp. D3o]MCT7952371.1 AAA family ATPase [Ancylothrix sp. D3o]